MFNTQSGTKILQAMCCSQKKKKIQKVNICIYTHTHINATDPFPFGSDFKILLGQVEKVAKLVLYLIRLPKSRALQEKSNTIL